MPQYKIADTFLQRIYSADEQKIVTHHQANLILRVLCAAQNNKLTLDMLAAFIEDHAALKGLLASAQDVKFVLRWHLRRLVKIGVVIEE
jgi:hypothetical protein